MAPAVAHPEIIEILSDDDILAAPSPSHAPMPRTAARASGNLDSPKRTSLPTSKKKTTNAHDAFVDRRVPASTPDSKHSTAIKADTDGAFRRTRDMPPGPAMSNRTPRENVSSAKSAKAETNLTSQRSAPTIVLDGSDDEAPQSLLKASPSFRPPVLTSENGAHARLESRGVPHSRDGNPPSPGKRPRERNSPSNSSGPSKKQKLTNNNSFATPTIKSTSSIGKPGTAGSASSSKPRTMATSRNAEPPSPSVRAKASSPSPKSRRKATRIVACDESFMRSWLATPGEPGPQGGQALIRHSLARPDEPSPFKRSAHLDSPALVKSQRDQGQESPPNERLRLENNGKASELVPKKPALPSKSNDGPRAIAQETRSLERHATTDLTSGKGSPAATRRGNRGTGLDEDQGYVSLSSSNGESSSQKRKRSLTTSRNPSTPILDVTQHGTHLRNTEVENGRGGSITTNDGVMGSPQASFDAAELLASKPSAKETTTPPKLNRNSPTKMSSAAPDEVEPKQKRSTPAKEVANSRHTTEAEEADLQLRSEALQGHETEVMLGDAAMPDAESAFAQPTVTASALKAVTLLSRLSLANRVERVLGQYMEELRGDSEYWTSTFLRRARHFKDIDDSTLSDAPRQLTEEAPTSFANLKPLKMSLYKKASSSAKPDELWGIQRMAPDGKAQARIEVSAPYTSFATDQQDVPNFAHYVSIQGNLLAPNVIHLHCWPYFGDDFDVADAQNLYTRYQIDISSRERKLLLLLQAQLHEGYVESALNSLECSWADVLRFLLEQSPDVGLDLDARKAFQNRALYCQEDFSRSSDRWVAVLNQLPPSSPGKLGRAALLCENFQKMAKFSLWHIARKSHFANLPEEESQGGLSQPADNELTCRICLRFNCPYHGQFKHHVHDSGGESDTESVSSVDTAIGTDIIHPLKANYRSRVAFAANGAVPEQKTLPDALLRKKQRDPNYWSGYRYKAHERGPFYPCSHPGVTCVDARCSCFVKMIPCEKTCTCASDCARKFKGCSCAVRKGNQMVCHENAECVCWQVGRECDPDLCGSCGVCDVVDPVNKYDDRVLVGHCRNSSIQRGVPKHTLLGDSGVHGLGLFACEDIRQNHFVGEYKGEIITKKEGDRRGAVHEHQKLSYLFSLNKSQEIDSTYFGNKMRFINHAHGDKANLYPRIIMVNTVHRIALYAGRDIPAGKELLFDYGPYFPDEQLQSKKSKKSAPHVRNANLVREFYDVSESEDEDGMLRAKAVSRGRGKQNTKKSRGGQRSGAGRKSQTGGKTGQQSEAKSNRADEGANEGANGGDDEKDAGQRLAAFNISDDMPSEFAEEAALPEEDDDEAFEPEEESDSAETEESDDGAEKSDFDEEDEEEDEMIPGTKRGRGRPKRKGVGTRSRARR